MNVTEDWLSTSCEQPSNPCLMIVEKEHQDDDFIGKLQISGPSWILNKVEITRNVIFLRKKTGMF